MAEERLATPIVEGRCTACWGNVPEPEFEGGEVTGIECGLCGSRLAPAGGHRKLDLPGGDRLGAPQLPLQGKVRQRDLAPVGAPARRTLDGLLDGAVRDPQVLDDPPSPPSPPPAPQILRTPTPSGLELLKRNQPPERQQHEHH